MKTKTLWRIHSWLGLLAGIPLLVVALTGSALVFKDEINAWLIPELVLVEPTDAGPLPLDERLAILREGLPEYEVTGWAFYEEPERSDFVYVIERGDHEWLHVYQNPYTGEILGEPGAAHSDLMGWLLVLHYSFFAHELGTVIGAVIALLLLALGISGFLVYRKFWRHFFLFRWRKGLRSLSGNLHKRIGVISAPVFFTLGLTGGIWNIAIVLEEIEHRDASGNHPVITGRFYPLDLSFDAMEEETRDYIPEFQARYIEFPWSDDGPVRFYGKFAGQNSFRSDYHSTVTYAAATGDYRNHARINEAPIVSQIYDAFTPLHFGTFGGWLSRIIWCVVGLSPGVLAVSGFFVWWKR